MSIPRMVTILRSMAAAQKSARMKVAGWKGQYVYKEHEEGYYDYSIVADLLGPTAIVTQTFTPEGETPEVSTFTLVENPDAMIYPFGVGCPYDCFIYSFDDFNCKDARNAKVYFSKQAYDLLGDGNAAYFMGVVGPDLDDAENYALFYPCTRT